MCTLCVLPRAIVLLMLLISSVQADFALTFAQDPNNYNPISTLDVDVGQSFKLEIYLSQSGGESRLSADGLLGFGTRGTFDSSVLQATSGTADNVFGFTAPADVSQTGQIVIYGGSQVAPKASLIHLATLRFLAINAGTTNFQLGDWDSDQEDFSLDDPAVTPIDADLFGPAQNQTFNLAITANAITAVPEPSSASLVVLAVFCWVAFRLRKHIWRLSIMGG